MTKETKMTRVHRLLARDLPTPRSPRLARVALTASALASSVLLLAAAGLPAAANAATPGPGLQLRMIATPTAFSAGDDSSGSGDRYTLLVSNVGAAATDGTPITITDTLPNGLSFTGAGCTISGQTATCTYDSEVVPPMGQTDPLYLGVSVDPGVPANTTLTSTATISGGGAAPMSTSVSTVVNPSTPPAFGVQDLTSYLADAGGAPDTQAGAHPNSLLINFDVNSLVDPTGTNPLRPTGDLKDVVVDLPVGFIGDPQAAVRCPLSALIINDGANGLPTSGCPAASEVGTLDFSSFGNWFQSSVGENLLAGVPIGIFNMVPERGFPAEFGFSYAGFPVLMYASVVGNGAGTHLRVTIPGIPAAGVLGTLGAQVMFFGNPAAQDGGATTPTAFFTNPSDCSGQPLTTTIHVDSYEDPGRHNPDGTPDFSDPAWKSATTTTPPVAGCNALHFAPTISLQPDTTAPDSPSGLNVDLQVPQNSDPNGLATPDLENATVTLPQGVTVSPSAANGLQGCSDAQFDVASNDPASCPLASQVGTVTLHTPLLPNPLPGEIYQGAPLCSPCSNADAQDGRMLREFIQIDDPVTGVVVKLPGTVSASPTTGQLTASFAQNPQLPFDDLKLAFKGGPRGVLSTPSTCGTFTSTADLSPWSSPFTSDALTQDSFTISGCGNPDTFAPTFTAGTVNPQAGAYSPFTLSFSRSDSDQIFSGLTASLPPGLVAKLAGVPLCSDSDANAGTCPASSQVGTVEAGAGPGSEPFFLPGSAYLTGPYKGAPYGLVIEVPAIAGPFNLGMVVVRQALYIDPTTAQVTAVSDPFPTILAGIPLQIRRIDVDLNRPDFTINPTSCDPMQISATLTSTGGMSAPVSSRFQASNCQALRFSPKLRMSLTGKGKTRSGDHPALVSTLTQPFGQANIHNVKVTLPLSMALDPNNSQHVCNYDVGLAVHGGAVGCPASTIVGSASAITPLLSQPLTGKVYLVQGIRFSKQGQRIRTLPSLLVPLRGQIALDLRAKTSVNAGSALVTTFSTIPDAAVSKFTLTITGGKKGLLVITGRGRTICGKPQITGATLGAQSGKTENSSIRMSTPCGKAKKAAKHGKKPGKK